jgi:hypothetical protein
MTYQVRESRIEFDKGTQVTLPFTVGDTALVDGVLIAVLKLPPGQSMTENVFGISPRGAILWQIERIPATCIDPVANQYVTIMGHDKGRVRVNNWTGAAVDVYVLTGKVKQWYWGKCGNRKEDLAGTCHGL